MNNLFTLEGLLLAGLTGMGITLGVSLWQVIKRLGSPDRKKVPDPKARMSCVAKTPYKNAQKGTQNRHSGDIYHSGLHPYHQDPYSVLELDTGDYENCRGSRSSERSFGGSDSYCDSSSSYTGSNSGED